MATTRPPCTVSTGQGRGKATEREGRFFGSTFRSLGVTTSLSSLPRSRRKMTRTCPKCQEALDLSEFAVDRSKATAGKATASRATTLGLGATTGRTPRPSSGGLRGTTGRRRVEPRRVSPGGWLARRAPPQRRGRTRGRSYRPCCLIARRDVNLWLPSGLVQPRRDQVAVVLAADRPQGVVGPMLSLAPRRFKPCTRGHGWVCGHLSAPFLADPFLATRREALNPGFAQPLRAL
jgi:hypothetical protein